MWYCDKCHVGQTEHDAKYSYNYESYICFNCYNSMVDEFSGDEFMDIYEDILNLVKSHEYKIPNSRYDRKQILEEILDIILNHPDF